MNMAIQPHTKMSKAEMDALIMIFQKELSETIDDGWKVSVERPNLNVARKRTQGTDVYRLRMVGELHFPIETVDKVLNDMEIRLKWDKGLAIVEVIETLENGLAIVYMSSRCPPGITDRDFLHARIHTHDVEKGEMIILDRSVAHPAKPVNKAYIRANTFFSGLVLTRKQTQVGGKVIDATKYAAICQVDICGDIPTLLINALASKATADWFGNLERACALYVEGKL